MRARRRAPRIPRLRGLLERAPDPEILCEVALSTALAPGEELRLVAYPEARAEAVMQGQRPDVVFYMPDWDYVDPEHRDLARLAIPDDRLEAYAEGVRALVERARLLRLVSPAAGEG